MKDTERDEFDTFRGILIGVIGGIILWGIILAIIYFIILIKG